MVQIDLVFIIIGIPRTTRIVKGAITKTICGSSVGEKPERQNHEDGGGHSDLDLPPGGDQEIQQQRVDHRVCAANFGGR